MHSYWEGTPWQTKDQMEEEVDNVAQDREHWKSLLELLPPRPNFGLMLC